MWEAYNSCLISIRCSSGAHLILKAFIWFPSNVHQIFSYKTLDENLIKIRWKSNENLMKSEFIKFSSDVHQIFIWFSADFHLASCNWKSDENQMKTTWKPNETSDAYQSFSMPLMCVSLVFDLVWLHCFWWDFAPSKKFRSQIKPFSPARCGSASPFGRKSVFWGLRILFPNQPEFRVSYLSGSVFSLNVCVWYENRIPKSTRHSAAWSASTL